MNFECQICHKVFEKSKSLHTHIKAHKISIGEYYEQFYPKYDKLTGEKIVFKNIDHYNLDFFKNKKNMNKWMANSTREAKRELCRDVLAKYIENKDLYKQFAPNYLYLLTHPRLPRKEFIEDYNDICIELGLKNIFKKFCDIKLFPVPKDVKIMQDTREQKPLSFKYESIVEKLSVGDYALFDNHYNNIFVDRKAEGDFISTMSLGSQRFKEELERAKEIDAYVFVVIESDIPTIYKNSQIPFRRKTNLDVVWGNMREIIVEYSDVCQFIFAKTRENMEVFLPSLLYNGQLLKHYDIAENFERIQWLG
jgi:hypothetical protein